MNDIEILEENIKENIEWLSTSSYDEIQCISIENLEKILSDYLNTKIKLKI